MSMKQSAVAILETADQIEIAGAKFYRRAATLVENGEQEIFLKLAELEDSHQCYFDSLKCLYSDADVQNMLDLDSANGRGLQAIAESHVLNSLEAFLDMDNLSMLDILQKALEFEKETVVYFSSLKSVIINPTEKDKIDLIIFEETSHVGSLTQKIQELTRNR